MKQRSKFSIYSMFGLLYFAQGAVLSYFTALNAIYLLSFGLSMGQIGLISGIALTPFILKIFLGILSDRISLFQLGHRKPYIVLGLLMQAVCLLIVPFINPGEQFIQYGVIAFLVMTGMALYDTTTDGLALDITPSDEAGKIQGIMVGGRAMGVVVLSSLIGILAQQVSWLAAFWLLALLTLLPLVLVIGFREPPRKAEQKFEWKAFSAFKSWPIIALGLLGALYSLIINATNEIINPFLQSNFGISVMVAGFYTTVWGLGVVLGGVTGGPLTDRIGQRRAVEVALIVSLFSVLVFSITPSASLAWPLVFIFGLAFGYYETVYFSISMRKSDPRIAASMFSILMAIANIGTGIGLPIAGVMVDGLGYQWTFAIIASLNLLAIPLLPAIFGKKEKMK
ncbi:MAG TPA: MFS transporter [Anaerolineaceae bacterium]|nr:MFS transporter [Anaerolineaceae bacterium]